MIGDWVLISVWDCNPFPSKVTSINYNSYQGKDFVDWIDTEDEEEIGMYAVQPIPLTPEILEKNGFEKYPYANNYWYCDDMLELFVKIVCIFPIKDRELRSSLSTATPRLTAGEDDVYIRCDYVHELQHALKLCGIEKEIVL